MADKASRTSSSLNGLMIAVMSFMLSSGLNEGRDVLLSPGIHEG
jgi:hypothetical protein